MSIQDIISEMKLEDKKANILRLASQVKISELRTVSRKFGVTGRSKKEIVMRLTS